jgi:hypothetical protein
MTTQHTPGPWTCHRSDWNDGAYYIEEVESQFLHNGELSPINGEIDEANALLIASAPELLAALQSLTTWVEEPALDEAGEDGKQNRLGIAKAAIAKATTNS